MHRHRVPAILFLALLSSLFFTTISARQVILPRALLANATGNSTANSTSSDAGNSTINSNGGGDTNAGNSTGAGNANSNNTAVEAATPTPSNNVNQTAATATTTTTTVTVGGNSTTPTTTSPTASQTFFIPPLLAGSIPPSLTTAARPSASVAFAPIPTSTPHGQTASQRLDCLAAHTTVRLNVSVIAPYAPPRKPLTYSTALEEKACIWAHYLAENNKFQHSSGQIGDNGENLYKISYSVPIRSALGSCRPAVNSWAAEVKYYKPGYRVGIDGTFLAYGHYTQLVWPTTAQVGCCGWKSLDMKSTVWACEYQIPGNWYGQKAY